MSHIANQRIKKGGKVILPGQPINLTEEELAELPDGAVSAAPVTLTDELIDAVSALPAEAFRKDGEIRTDALKELCEHLGYDVTAEQVAEARAASAE